jgi:2-dehydropantoate 2-reductase
MDICVFGAGSLGSLVGGLLAETHEVTLVGRAPHTEAVEASGLQMIGAFDRTVDVAARTDSPDSADLVLVTVKSFDTAQAARELASMDVASVLSLQNGMGNEQQLAEALSCPVLAGTCTYGARLLEPGVIECTGRGTVALGAWDGGPSSTAKRVGDAFEQTDIDTTVSAEMPRRLWRKLAINAGINATTALARVPNGALVDGPATSVLREATRETAQTARAHGIDLSPEEVVDQTVAVAESTARNDSSMVQDIEAGSRTEIDAINGYVVENANGSVPVNETLTSLVRAWEREHVQLAHAHARKS